MRNTLIKCALFCLTLFLLISNPIAQAQVITKEINSLNQIKPSLSNLHSTDTLFVFDIDNTLLTETGNHYYIGSPMWFNWQVEQINTQGKYAVVSQLNDLYPFNNYVLQHLSTKVCEKSTEGTRGTTDFFNYLKEHNYDVIAATARDNAKAVFDATYKQLAAARLASALSENIHIANAEQLGTNTYFDKGLLMLRGQNKGQFVYALLKQSNKLSRFKNVIFVDDTEKNIVAFTDYFKANAPGINVYAYHYNHELQEVKYFTNHLDNNINGFRDHLVTQDKKEYAAYKQ